MTPPGFLRHISQHFLKVLSLTVNYSVSCVLPLGAIFMLFVDLIVIVIDEESLRKREESPNHDKTTLKTEFTLSRGSFSKVWKSVLG